MRPFFSQSKNVKPKPMKKLLNKNSLIVYKRLKGC